MKVLLFDGFVRIFHDILIKSSENLADSIERSVVPHQLTRENDRDFSLRISMIRALCFRAESQ